MIDRWLDVFGLWLDSAWAVLVLMCKVSVILGVLVGGAYVAIEGLPSWERVRVEIVIGPGAEGSVRLPASETRR